MRVVAFVVAALSFAGCASFDPMAREVVAYELWRGDTARFVDVGNGVRIYTEVHKPHRSPLRPPVLVLHGGLGATDIMAFQIRALAADRTVIAVDTRGHGRSSEVTGALHYDDFVADFVGVLDAVGVRRVDVVGWSDGAIEALRLAELHPDRVRRVVAISANVRPDGVTAETIAELQNCGADGKGDELVDEVRAFYALIGADVARVTPLALKICDLYKREPNMTHDDLGRIAAPTLVMAGENDLITVAHTTEIASSIPNATLRIVPGAKHSLPIDIPDVVDAAMLAFLDRD